MSKAENTRRFIVEKTANIFNKKGVAGTSLSDLTAATGLTKGSIYGNFVNKDEVALAVFDYNLGRLEGGLNAAAAESTNALDKLRNMANFYRSKHLASTGGCPLLNTAIEADDTHPPLKERAARGVRGWKKKIESIIEQGIKSKEIKSTIHAGEFATTWIAMIEGGIMISKLTGNYTMLDTVIARLERMINDELKK